MTANERQVGGSHYQSGGDQHWDLCSRYDAGYLEGQISKYVHRWRRKNGVEDLEKAGHFCQKLREMVGHMDHSSGGSVPLSIVQGWCSESSVPETESMVVECVLCWRHLGARNLLTASLLIDKLIAEAQSAETRDTETKTMDAYVAAQDPTPRHGSAVSGPGTLEDGGHHARDGQRWPVRISAEQYIQYNLEPHETIDHGSCHGMWVTSMYTWDAGHRLHVMQEAFREEYGDDSIVPHLSEVERHQPELTHAEYQAICRRTIEHGVMKGQGWWSVYTRTHGDEHPWSMLPQFREEYAS